jgi:transposase
MRGRIAALAIADAAYDAGRIRTVIATKQAEAVIPSNPSRTRKPPACLGS